MPAAAPPSDGGSASSAAFVGLPVAGHGDAVVSVPLGPSRRRPVLVAAGGAGDTPEWQCEAWREIVDDRAFVLCPRGLALNPRSVPADRRYYYRNHFALEREVLAGLDALRARFGDLVDGGPVVYAGFSQGATMGMLVVLRNPSRLRRAILIEGGSQKWDLGSAQRFRRSGGERVLLVCGQAGCFEGARVSSEHLGAARVEARAVWAQGEGHTYGGGVAVKVRENFDWLVQGDSRWENAPR